MFYLESAYLKPINITKNKIIESTELSYINSDYSKLAIRKVFIKFYSKIQINNKANLAFNEKYKRIINIQYTIKLFHFYYKINKLKEVSNILYLWKNLSKLYLKHKHKVEIINKYLLLNHLSNYDLIKDENIAALVCNIIN